MLHLQELLDFTCLALPADVLQGLTSRHTKGVASWTWPANSPLWCRQTVLSQGQTFAGVCCHRHTCRQVVHSFYDVHNTVQLANHWVCVSVQPLCERLVFGCSVLLCAACLPHLASFALSSFCVNHIARLKLVGCLGSSSSSSDHGSGSSRSDFVSDRVSKLVSE